MVTNICHSNVSIPVGIDVPTKHLFNKVFIFDYEGKYFVQNQFEPILFSIIVNHIKRISSHVLQKKMTLLCNSRWKSMQR